MHCKKILQYKTSSFLQLRLISIVLCICFLHTAQSQPYLFNHLTTENGLQNSSVVSVTQDSTGFMWFGTIAGISRYDGATCRNYEFNRIENDVSILDYPLSLKCDQKKRLWVGTTFGLKLYNEKKDLFENIPLARLKGGSVNCIYEDKKGGLWVGTSEGLFKSVELNNQLRFEPYSAKGNLFAAKNIRAIFEDSKGILWVGTSNGLNKLKPEDPNTVEVFYANSSDLSSLSSNFITAITEDAHGNIWVGTQNEGVNRYNAQTKTFTRIKHSEGLVSNNIRSILFSRDKQLWIGTQEGISILDAVTGKMYNCQNDVSDNNSLSRNSVYNLFEDNDGTIWVGTYYGGVNYRYSFGLHFYQIQNRGQKKSISNNVVSNIAEDKNGNLWIATEGGGLNFLDKKTSAVTVYKNNPKDPGSLGSNLIRSVYVDKEQNVWCGTHGGGLNVLPKGKQSFQRYLFSQNDLAAIRTEFFSILEDDKNRLWVTSYKGLFLFRKDGTNLTPLPSETIRNNKNGLRFKALLKDKNGDIWIGGEPGLYMSINDSLIVIDKQLMVNCLQQDSKGNIWIGLTKQGLAVFNSQTKSLEIFTGKLPAQNVFGILEDVAGNLWLSTENGLIKFDPQKGTTQLYTVSDGLSGNEFNTNSFLKTANGEFYFGGFNGITYFFPHQVTVNKRPAPLVFTGLKLFNKELNAEAENPLLNENINTIRELKLKHDQNVVTIEFALLNFIKSNKNKYEYKLESFDKEWVVTDNSYVTYTNLPPGKYVFRVRGANNDGVWSELQSLEVHVMPPLWRTWWAYLLYALLLFSILFLLVRYFFLQTLLKKEEELHQVKLNFFTNVSHEIRTHLSLIVAPIENLVKTNTANSFLTQQLKTVKTNADRLLRLVNELMDFRKAETNHLNLQFEKVDLVSFLQEIYESFRELSVEKEIAVSFIHNTNSLMVSCDKTQMGKVFYNLLTNAFKFTGKSGQIQMLLEQHDSKAIIKIIDNGSGIAPEYLDKIFDNYFQVPDYQKQNTGYGLGLALSKTIVQLHHGSISAFSGKLADTGVQQTVFTVTIPLALSEEQKRASMENEIPLVSAGIDEQVSEMPSGKEIIEEKKIATLLIVDDNAELRDLIRESFTAHYQIFESENGIEALKVANEQIPDLIISDVMMPEMNGFEFCEKIKTDERTSHIPVILLTAKTTQNDQLEGLETGAELYLTKPFSIRVLELSVRNLLNVREKLWTKFLQMENTPAVKEDLSYYKNNIDKEFILKMSQLVDEHMGNSEFGVDMLSRKMNMSAPIVYRKLKGVTGLTVNEFIKKQRLQKAADLLLQTDFQISEIADSIGYTDTKYFGIEFKKRYGMPPSEYRKTKAG
jgi:ligand-binding sensor domain-containing protein/signal transduction histidine kinase/DNA-binding response OmpR family regulator